MEMKGEEGNSKFIGVARCESPAVPNAKCWQAERKSPDERFWCGWWKTRNDKISFLVLFFRSTHTHTHTTSVRSLTNTNPSQPKIFGYSIPFHMILGAVALLISSGASCGSVFFVPFARLDLFTHTHLQFPTVKAWMGIIEQP